MQRRHPTAPTARLLSSNSLAPSRRRSAVRPEATPSEWGRKGCASHSHHVRLSRTVTKSARAAIRWMAASASPDATRISPGQYWACSLPMCLRSTSTPAQSSPESGKAKTRTLSPRSSPSARLVPAGCHAKTSRASSATRARALASVGDNTPRTLWRARLPRSG